jgi:hypothetical protein
VSLDDGSRALGLKGESASKVQVQVFFTSVDGQVQPLDVALGHSVCQRVCDSSAKWNISHLASIRCGCRFATVGVHLARMYGRFEAL